MKVLRLFLPLLAIYLCNCPLPTDPLQNYGNCDVDFTDEKSTESYRVGDTVTITIALELPHLLDTIKLSIGDEDTAIVCDYSIKTQDTIVIKKVFSSPDTITLALEAFKKDGSLDSASLTLIISGDEPGITRQPSNLYTLEPGYACTLSVSAEGSKPLHFQWIKGDDKRENDTLDTLIIPYFQEGDTGEYYCTVSNAWGSDTSKSATLIVKTFPGKKVFWKFGIYLDSLYESETLKVAIDDYYSVPSDEDPTLTFISSVENAALSGGSLFSFFAGRHDSGIYSLPIILNSESGADTATISVKVLPRYCTLTLKADSGSIEADPEKDTY
ncbi:MAG: immunoglobulin domain-containing protein [Chitinispirillaceae bacterium]|nr:immunoglobulin domain-containing protein [Chitinispirillaceae bacterium]